MKNVQGLTNYSAREVATRQQSRPKCCRSQYKRQECNAAKPNYKRKKVKKAHKRHKAILNARNSPPGSLAATRVKAEYKICYALL